jgi:hypothetical protein
MQGMGWEGHTGEAWPRGEVILRPDGIREAGIAKKETVFISQHAISATLLG